MSIQSLRFSLKALIPALALVTASPAMAQFAKPEDAVKYRQSAFVLMGAHMGRLAAVVKGETPYNRDEVVRNAAVIGTLSSLPWQAFPAGTESGKTPGKNDALPVIWTENAKFKSAADRMQAAVAELNTAAQSGNPENLKKALGATSQTCKACHDDFRKK
ncbi:cytochrome c [Polynucleobacter sp. HIN6]|uniref:c-type cytochrome n=1 Tax=Polynucleobacter sp. HIN6 TaxID=3047865 RepID=UPI0025729680|nr:cytochrome c [Polynucleobacter sp. HIN6]BEI34870.1 cytochrome c [Polynucleobacter sp. HIN6]